MRVGEWLESSSRWNEAAQEYATIVELYPQSALYEEALKKAALLFSHPDNTLRNDSTASEWLDRYSRLSLPPGELLSLQLNLRRMSELEGLREQLSLEAALSDSILASQRELQEEIAVWSKKVKDLQDELQKVNQELSLMREIDAKVGRERGDRQ